MGAILLGLAALVGMLLGASHAALRTAAGRDVVVRAGLRAANDALNGRLTVGRVGGSIRSGLEAEDVVLEGPDSTTLARIPRITMTYGLRDLLSGRIVLGSLTLERPEISLVQLPNGRLNLEEMVDPSDPGENGNGHAASGGGRRPLIAFHRVVIEDATLWVRTRIDADDRVPEPDRGPRGDFRVRRIENLGARLSYLRLSSPREEEKAFRLEIERLTAKVSDPLLDIRDASGWAEIEGRELRFELARAHLPATAGTVGGTIRWPRDTVRYDLHIDTRNGDLNDIRGIARTLPRGLSATGAYTVRSLPGDQIEIRSPRTTVAGRGGGGSFTGQLGIVLGPGESWSARETDVVLDNFDLEYARPLLDTLPIAGRLTGAIRADGPRERLRVVMNVEFRDSLVPGWPQSRTRTEGVISFGGPRGAVFRAFALRSATFDLGTVRRILPAVRLQGLLDGSGTLNGPWLEAEFSGTMRHRDETGIESVARGVIRYDARGDTLGVWANVAMDSLRFEGLRSSYPSLTLRGAFAGDVRLSGFADSLATAIDLTGPAGRVAGSAVVTVVGTHLAAREVDLEFRDLSLDALHERFPASVASGRARGHIDVDTLTVPDARLDLVMDSSRVGGSPVDSLRALVRAADSVLRIDTIMVWMPGVRMAVSGRFGLAANRADALGFVADADSVTPLEPLFRELFKLEADTASGGPRGAVAVRGSVSGWTGDFRVAAEVSSPLLEWGQLRLTRARGSGDWRSTTRGQVRLAAAADSLALSGYQLMAVEAGIEGRRDSLGWWARSSLKNAGRLVAGGTAQQDSLALAVPFDSLLLDLPVLDWALDTAAIIVITDSSVHLRNANFSSIDGGARVQLNGSYPRAGAGDLTVAPTVLPLRDLYALLQLDQQAVAGELSGTVNLTGTAREPLIRGSLALVNGRFGEFQTPHLEGTVNYGDRRLRGAVALRRLGERILDLELDLPLDLALAGARERRLPGSLMVRAVADSVDLAFSGALVPTIRDASGRLDADVGITGTWDRPVLTGSASITNGAATFPEIGVRHEQLNGRFTMVADTIKVDALSVMSGKGSLRATGFVRLEELTRPILGLHVEADQFHLMKVRNFMEATTTGAIDLTGPMMSAQMTGRGTVTEGTLYFTDLVTKQIVNLEDTLYREVVDTSLIRARRLGRAFENRLWDSLTMDLQLTMGSEVWLRSSEANIQLAGDLDVNKSGDQYQLYGVLTALRGSYRLKMVYETVSREFTVTRGEVQYFGTTDFNASLDIDARHVVRQRVGEPVTISVHIGGTLYVPRLRLSSDARPPLADDEIIAMLLFGTRSFESFGSSGGAEQGRRVTQEALRLLSGQLESSVISNLGVPLDYLQIVPEVYAGRTGWQIAAGWQVDILGAPFFLAVSPRICTGRALSQENFGASLEYRLSSQWRVSTSLDPVRSCSILEGDATQQRRQFGFDLFWEKRY